MARTITALFDTKADADAGAARLRQAGIDSVHVHEQATHHETAHSDTADTTTLKDRGMWAAIKNAVLPAEDRHTYEEGVRRGGFLLTADVDDDATPAAVRALEEANSVDLDERSQQWRTDGWNYQSGTSDLDDDDVIYADRDTAYSSSRFRSYGTPIDRS